MQVRDVMVKNVISVVPDDTISAAFAKMRKHNIHQLLVVADKTLYGLLELKNIVTKDMDPSTTKVAGLSINVPTIDANAGIEEVAPLLLNAGLRAMPVREKGELAGIISETDLMKVAKNLVKVLNVKVHEIIAPAEYVEKNASIGSVQRIMRDKNVSRVPVVENGKAVGVIGTMDLVKLLEGKERMAARGGRLQEAGAKEKITIEQTSAEAFMRTPALAAGDRSISEVIELLKANEEVVVEHGGTIGVVTPKDILELFTAVPKKQLYVQITGMQNESIEFKVKMDQAVNEFVQKMGKMIDNIEYLFFHVDKIEKGGKRDLYSIRARFKVPFGFFAARASGWQPINVIQDVIDNLEREVLKKYGKMEDTRRKKRQKYRYS